MNADAGDPAREEHDPALEAAQARERAALELAAHPPELTRAANDLILFIVEASDNATRELARCWLTALGKGPDASLEAAQWWRQAASDSDPCLRAHLGYALGLACRETRIRGHQRWDEEDVEWVLRLVDRCGYRWTDWEAERFCEHFGVSSLKAVAAEQERPERRTFLVTAPLPARITELTADQAAAVALGECRAKVALAQRDLAILNNDPLGDEAPRVHSCAREAGHGEHLCSLQPLR